MRYRPFDDPARSLLRFSFAAVLPLAASIASATFITFPPASTVSYNNGTYWIDRDGYRFSKSYYLAINTYTDPYRHTGGLWVHPLGGVGVLVERLDGQPFSLDAFTVMERPGLSGYIQYDPFLVTAYNPGNPFSFGCGFYSDYNNHTYDTFHPVAQNSRFANVSKAWIYNEYPFILDTLELNAVPEPATAAALGLPALLLALKRRKRSSYSS